MKYSRDSRIDSIVRHLLKVKNAPAGCNGPGNGAAIGKPPEVVPESLRIAISDQSVDGFRFSKPVKSGM